MSLHVRLTQRRSLAFRPGEVEVELIACLKKISTISFGIELAMMCWRSQHHGEVVVLQLGSGTVVIN